MAYWTIDFVTKADRYIHIKIYGKSGNTDVALTPSDNPCVLEEEGKENLFMPIKTQSGYIEVISDSIDFVNEIIPITGGSRSVVIYETANPTSYTTPLWAGYIQPKLFTFKIWNGKQVVRIPIECKLSALRYGTITLPSSNSVKIGTMLYRILSKFDYAYFQGGIVFEREDEPDDVARAWLWKKVYTTLFSEEKNWYNILEYICTFFGWTVRQHGISAYFMANRNVDASNTTVRRILVDGLNPNEIRYSSEECTWEEVELDGDMLASMSNSVKFVEGCRTVKATCLLVTFDQDIDIDFVRIGGAIDYGSINPTNSKEEREWSESGHDYKQVTHNEWSTFGQPTPITIGDFTLSGYNTQTILAKNGSNDQNEWTTKLVVWYTTDYLTDTYTEAGTEESPAYETTTVSILGQQLGELIFTSNNSVVFNTKGTLVIKPQIDNEFSGAYAACFYIQIGTLWYNPSNNTWQTNQPNAYCKLEQSNKDGYTIPIPQAMSGNLVITFIPDKNRYTGINCYTGMGYALLGVSAEFTAEQAETYNSQIGEVKYSAENGAGFEKEVSFESKICIKGTLAASSKNFLLDPNGDVCQGLFDTPYSDAQAFSPLQRLCDQAADEMSKVGKMYEIVALWRGGMIHDITPLTMIYIEPLNEWCYPVSAKYNLRDDLVQLRLVKREYSEGNQ